MRYVSETTKRVIIGNRLVKGEGNCIEKELCNNSQIFHGLKEEVKSKWRNDDEGRYKQ